MFHRSAARQLRALLAVTTILLVSTPTLAAQRADSTLTVERIFGAGEFSARRLSGARWRPGMDAYTRLEPSPGRSPLQGVDHAQHADHRGGVDVAAAGLVVEAHVPADHGQVEGAAGLGHPVDGLRELPHHLGVLRVAEVQAVDERERPRPDAGQVEDRLGYDARRTGPRADRAPPVVAVGGQGQRPPGVGAGDGVLQAQHGRIAAWSGDGVEEELVVVLPPHPGRVREHPEQVRSAVGGRVERRRIPLARPVAEP